MARKDPDGKKFFYHPDHLGSTALITNESGAVVEETTYEPFGKVYAGGSDRFLYTGKELDRGTGLEYYGARYYDPSNVSQFVQPDSLIPDIYDPQSLNRYSYVLNNPYKYTDPSGNSQEYDATAIYLDLDAIWQDPGNAWNYLALIADGVASLSPRLTGGREIVKGAERVVTKAATTIGKVAKGAGKKIVEGAEWVGKQVKGGIDWLGKTLFGKAGAVIKYDGKILTYREAQKITMGKVGEIQAHHILEQRHLKNWGYSAEEIANAPSIVLTNPEHDAVTTELRRVLPYGVKYSPDEVWEGYQDVYKNNPELLEAIAGYFK